ncbi:hypothetical protein VE03_06949 [Pseudogymnoascus sp. 23342-1-I1]|nr:hypothetical protein VE03_06949 [Pseudogymnoascus sp. 23342-1-I1]
MSIKERWRRYTNIVDDQTVVKSGEDIKIEEIHALRLAEQLQLPVPHVHEAHSTPDGGTAIRMDYIPGENLKEVWPSMTPGQKNDIAIQLRDIIDKMRSLASESNAIRSCSGGGIRDLRSYFDYNGGLFPDEESFNSFILDFRPKVTPKAVLRGLNSLPTCNHRLTFSHCDLSQHNFIVRDNKIVGLIDWEFAGWFPEYWEYIKFFERPSHRDWFDYSDIIFSQKYDKELIDFQAIIHWQRR